MNYIRKIIVAVTINYVSGVMDLDVTSIEYWVKSILIYVSTSIVLGMLNKNKD